MSEEKPLRGIVSSPAIRLNRPRNLLWARKWGTLIGFVALVVLFSLLRPDVFPSVRNWSNIIEQVATLAIVAVMVTIVMVTGDFDLSVGALASLAGVVAADLMANQGVPVALAILVALLVGMAGGAINGLLVAYGGLSAFVATLATMTAYGGAALLYTNGATIFSGIPESFRWLGQGNVAGIPASVIVMLIVVFLAWLLMEQTVFGRRLYAIGGNTEASYLVGISVQRLRLMAFTLSGLGAALSGVILTSRLFSAHPQAGNPFMLNAAAAVFLGATAFREGEPHVLGTVLGVLIMGVLGNGLNILGVNSYIQSILTGVIIVLAVLISSLSRRR
ncbi:MAG: ABC transporter permease [Anaerolineae bacterium]|nr:ABC transporter permease [Candidatus Roseilinea sp.]MDW8449294.1 ABC transporter permease [Anaerolineae bacterium]